MASTDEVQKGVIAQAMATPQYMLPFVSKTTNPRGIPTIVFIEDVASFLKDKSLTVEAVIGAFTEMLQKYKLMEQSLTRQKASLKQKIPDIDNTLELVEMLRNKRDDGDELVANYPLSEVVHARAKVTCNGTVCLWLGANVMVEYTVEDAIAMLQTNASNAADKMEETAEDLAHLKDQITCVEVNMARVFNYNVKVTRAAKEAAAAAASK